MTVGLLCASGSASAKTDAQWLGENESIPVCGSIQALRKCSLSDSDRKEVYRSGDCKTIRGRTKWHYLASGGMLGDIAFVRFSPDDGPSSTGWVHTRVLEDRSVPSKPSTKAGKTKAKKKSEQAKERKTCS